jgi:hypothetical protein
MHFTTFARSPSLQRSPKHLAALNKVSGGHNKNVQSIISSLGIQPKLQVGGVNDPQEKEADKVADQVLKQAVNNQGSEFIQRKCESCEEQEELQMKRENGASSNASANLSSIASSASQALPTATNQFMSNAIGYDFSNVRLHTDAAAQAMNKQLGSRAFTTGQDIYFNKNQYQPETSQGKHLLAHELTHVVQQNKGDNVLRRSCSDGNCEDCAGGWRDLSVSVFFARRANTETMQNLRAAIDTAKQIMQNCCIRLKFDFNWSLIPNATNVDSASLHRRPAGDADGLFDVPEPVETIGESDLISRARGIPMLVVDEVRNTGGATTILGGQDDQGRDFDVEYTGPDMFLIAVNQPHHNGNFNHIAHEIWHITGALRHSAAEGDITAGVSNAVSQTYCDAVRGVAT